MSKTYIATTAEQLGAMSIIAPLITTMEQFKNLRPGPFFGYYVASNDVFPTNDWFHGLMIQNTDDGNNLKAIAISANGNELWYKNIVNGTDKGWFKVANANSYLLLDGSKAMTGNLQVGDGYGQILSDFNTFQMFARKNKGSDANIRKLMISNQNIPLSQGVIFSEVNNNVENQYNIFGEHNTPLLAKAVEKEIQNGGLSTLDNAIQIFSGKVSKSQNFEVIGKGIMFITPSANMYAKPSVTADNVSLGTTNIISGQTIEIGFLNNCVVTAGSSDDAIYCNAVCY